MITIALGLAIGLIIFAVIFMALFIKAVLNDPHSWIDPEQWDAHDEATAKYGKNYLKHPEYKKDYERLMNKHNEELRTRYDKRMKP